MSNAPRKTFSVAALLFRVNKHNATCSTSSRDFRRAHNIMLDHVLHETGNYVGFGYLRACDVPDGATPGIRSHADGSPDFTGCDDSRVLYYISKTLRAEYNALEEAHAARESAHAEAHTEASPV